MSLSFFPAELQDLILDFHLYANPQSRLAVTSLSKKIRQHLRHHRTTKLSIYASEPFLPRTSVSSTVVFPDELERFIADVRKFFDTFDTSSISFGEIESVQIHLPFDAENLVESVLQMLGLLGRRRRITFVKFTGWEDRMDLENFIVYVGELGPGVAQARTLELVFNSYGHDGGEDEEVSLPSWKLWHTPSFFDFLTPFSSLVCLKLRTALEVFPVVTGHKMRNVNRIEERWVSTLGEKLPSLRRIHVAHSFSEQLHYEGSIWYSGDRVVRYRSALGEQWERGCWFFCSPNNDSPLHLRQKETLHNPRTTEIMHFDPWESDGEYTECQEDGWEANEAE